MAVMVYALSKFFMESKETYLTSVLATKKF